MRISPTPRTLFHRLLCSVTNRHLRPKDPPKVVTQPATLITILIVRVAIRVLSKIDALVLDAQETQDRATRSLRTMNDSNSLVAQNGGPGTGHGVCCSAAGIGKLLDMSKGSDS